MTLTHKELVEAAYKWVLKSGGCGVAFKELHTNASNGEYPDVIGFSSWGNSVLIECKCSRSDFLADKKKQFRIYPEQGMGSERFYACPTGLLKKEDLPNGWGLIYVNEKKRATCVFTPMIEKTTECGSPYKVRFKHDKNMHAEHGLMYSALRRLHIKGHIDCIYDKQYNNF